MYRISSVVAGAALIAAQSASAGNPSKVVPELQEVAAAPEVVAAVKAHNRRNLTLEQIKELDKQWSEAGGELALAEEVLGNAAAQYLAQVESEKGYLVEAILTGNQGANVAITGRTSDYWQGDEPKFVRSLSGGKGAVFVDRPKRDNSTGEVTVQVSVPVMDAGAAIGTLTWGVRVDQLP